MSFRILHTVYSDKERSPPFPYLAGALSSALKLVYWLLLVILIVIFGSNYTSAKFALKYSSPLVFALLRAALGSAFSFPFSVYMIRKMGKSSNNQSIRKNSLPRDRKTLLFVILFGITSSTFFFGFWYAGEVYTSASISSVLVNASPLFTVILAYLFLKNSVTRNQIVGLALGFAGVSLVASNGTLSSFYGGGLGFILLLLSAASYAGSLIIYRRFLQSLRTNNSEHAPVFSLPPQGCSFGS